MATINLRLCQLWTGIVTDLLGEEGWKRKVEGDEGIGEKGKILIVLSYF